MNKRKRNAFEANFSIAILQAASEEDKNMWITLLKTGKAESWKEQAKSKKVEKKPRGSPLILFLTFSLLSFPPSFPFSLPLFPSSRG